MPKKGALQVEVTERVDAQTQAKEEDIAPNLRVTLENINTQEGVIGYILRSPTSASVDLKDSARIIDYAILSATAFESSENLSRLFGLGKIRNVLLEGKDVKILCLTIGNHRLSVFMEKSVDHNSIYKKLT
jgi:predicted regulator of Ras-like GTPase activity (Roadblock/LC7/MglB family)